MKYPLIEALHDLGDALTRPVEGFLGAVMGRIDRYFATEGASMPIEELHTYAVRCDYCKRVEHFQDRPRLGLWRPDNWQVVRIVGESYVMKCPRCLMDEQEGGSNGSRTN